MSLPPQFAERIRGLLGAEAEALLAALEGPPLAGLRANTLKLSAEELRDRVPWALDPVPWCPNGFVVAEGERPGRHPYHAAGLYYMQEPSAMAVAEALAPRPGELVLDLAAAPGGKSTHLAALLGGQGLLVSNEIEPQRTAALAQNLERWGARRALITGADPAHLAATWGPIFDRVLLDAPCSGEGMFRKTPAALEAWSPEVVRGCALRQGRAVEAAAALVRPGGVLAYSTCTFAPEENEETIARFLRDHPEFELLPVRLPELRPGRPEWLPPELARPELALAGRLWPHLVRGEGHFVALLRKAGEPSRPREDRAEQPTREPEAARDVGPERSERAPRPGAKAARAAARREQGQTQRDRAAAERAQARRQRGGPTIPGLADAGPAERELWRAFVADALRDDPAADMLLTSHAGQLYAVAHETPPLAGVRVVRPGLWLGTLQRDRLEPSHSLALALRASEAQQTLSLAPDDERLARYLAGHPLPEPGPKGWVLIAVDGFPIGWGRRAGDVVKNAYPKGLRRN